MANDNGRQAGPRCIALVGPFASGKTSLLEAILMRTGAINRQGHSKEGNMVGDASQEARANAMSVEVNVAETTYMDDRLTFIDCPGSVEFQYEALPVLAGVDMAVVVAEADPKKVPALQLILRDLEARRLPHLIFLNKIDKLSGSVRDVLQMLQPASRVPLVLRQLPMTNGGVITGCIDLALERAHVYHEARESEIIELPDAEKAAEIEARTAMLEQIADFDDTLMEQLLEDVQPERSLVFKDLVAEMRAGRISPVFIGSAEHGNGITRLLKAIRHEAPTVRETRERLGLKDVSGTVVQVMKTMQTARSGKMCVARVLAGSVTDGMVLRSADGRESKVSGLFRVMGQETQKRDAAQEGETVALGKVEAARTGDTLSTGMVADIAPLPESMPMMSIAVAPRERKDDVRLSAALQRIIEEDPSLRLVHVPETGETVLEGHGEMHLRVVMERLTNRYGVPITTSVPRIAYRETIRKSANVRGRHKKQSGGHGQFGDVVLTIKPTPRGSGVGFDESITGGVVPRQYISSVEAGVREYFDMGGPLGFPVVDVAVTLTDGSYHTVDSSDMAFRQAAQIGMREGMPQCEPVLLEPVMDVTVRCPSEATARINAILPRRRGQIVGSDARDGWHGWDEIHALVPASEMQDLIVELRSATAGVGSFVQEFDHLAEMSGRLADEVAQKYGRHAGA
ncbi:elongation factor G [Devosia sp. ZB163]|uniref:elongation factor G n=1 Tax=Devosia sp. ZB163 TaxID=3025938 RepID=UPI00235F8305|nr:elongation factor G [Devosia sp. ZB163]MDC9823997.1 elongation factor G [Devosia sp. ZB163]